MSKTIDDGGPAYPQHGWSSSPEVLERMKNQGGMTLRDWFAGRALALMSGLGTGHAELKAKEAYQIADAMIAARKATE